MALRHYFAILGVLLFKKYFFGISVSDKGIFWVVQKNLTPLIPVSWYAKSTPWRKEKKALGNCTPNSVVPISHVTMPYVDLLLGAPHSPPLPPQYLHLEKLSISHLLTTSLYAAIFNDRKQHCSMSMLMQIYCISYIVKLLRPEKFPSTNNIIIK